MSTILSKLGTILTCAAKGKHAQHEVHTVLFAARNGSPHAQFHQHALIISRLL